MSPSTRTLELAGARQYLDDQSTDCASKAGSRGQVAVGRAARAHRRDRARGASGRRGDGDARARRIEPADPRQRRYATVRQTTAPLLLVRPSALHQDEPDDREPAHTGTVDEPSGPTVEVRLTAADLELIDHGLKAIAHAPGYDYGHVLAAQALAKRLEASTRTDVSEPVTAR